MENPSDRRDFELLVEAGKQLSNRLEEDIQMLINFDDEKFELAR